MPKLSPLQKVKKEHGSKDELVAKIAALLPADPDEEKDEFIARLKTVANAKLLRLVAIGEEAAKLGGREGLAEKIAELKNQAKDEDFKRGLQELPLPRLLDQYQSLARKAKAAKKS
ncbi:MAG: hypothetical protein H6713_06970 [Myxococcales bacterium]|nr:hypothetical protein [Myxococcales bacterium]MCB9749735.1 hypothetical protein [Myxococcales bacterium]